MIIYNNRIMLNAFFLNRNVIKTKRKKKTKKNENKQITTKKKQRTYKILIIVTVN